MRKFHAMSLGVMDNLPHIEGRLFKKSLPELLGALDQVPQDQRASVPKVKFASFSQRYSFKEAGNISYTPGALAMPNGSVLNVK